MTRPHPEQEGAAAEPSPTPSRSPSPAPPEPRPLSRPGVAAALFGAGFLVVGALGFVPGLTADHDQLAWAGHGSGALLLGLFQVSVLHNVAHLVLGAAGILTARRAPRARAYLLTGGVVYGVLTVHGLLVDHDSSANVLPLNQADNWLHAALAVAMLGFGLALTHRPGRRLTPRS